MAKIEKVENIKSGQDVETVLHCWWEYILVQLFWKLTIPTKFKCILLYDPAITYPTKNMYIYLPKDMH